MACSSLASPFLPPLHSLKNPNPNSSSPRLSHRFFRFHASSPRRNLAASASAAGTAASEEARRRRILESYGLDPDDFADEPPPRSTRKQRGRRRQERGEAEAASAVAEKSAPAPPRTTHKLLQVLAGKARRRKLLSPKGMDVRPMMEVVRGAAFDILQSAGGCPSSLAPGRWLDLYSGTGSVGIEAMSRGCSEAHFVEMDPWVVSEVLRPNLECTGFLDSSHIHMIRVESFLQRAEQSTGKDRSFDYISVTPPYIEVNYSTLMDQLASSPLVGEDCFILVEYPLKTSMAESCGNLIKIADRRFGRTNLLIYGPTWAEKKRKPRKKL